MTGTDSKESAPLPRDLRHHQHADDTASKISRRRSSSSVVTATTIATHRGDGGHGIGSREASGFLMRPILHEKFDRRKVEDAVENAIREYMNDKRNYLPEEAMEWTTELSMLVNKKVKELNFPRYKICSNVLMGENIGGGIHSGFKFLWDADTDVYATYTYMTDALFVVATVCGIFYY